MAHTSRLLAGALCSAIQTAHSETQYLRAMTPVYRRLRIGGQARLQRAEARAHPGADRCNAADYRNDDQTSDDCVFDGFKAGFFIDETIDDVLHDSIAFLTAVAANCSWFPTFTTNSGSFTHLRVGGEARLKRAETRAHPGADRGNAAND